MTRDEPLVATGFAEDRLEFIVGRREPRVIVAREEPGAEDVARLLHVLERLRSSGLGIALDRGLNVRQERIEGASDTRGRRLDVQKLGRTDDEAVKEPYIARGSMGEVQSDLDVLTKLPQEERSSAPFFSP